MPSTTFCVWPFFKRFEQHVANYFNFSPLFVLFMFFNFLCSLVITLPCEICLSSFHLWAHVKMTPCWASFCVHSFLCFVLFFKHFSFMFFPLGDDTHIFNLTCVIPLAFNHFVFQLVLWGWMFILTSARLGPFSLPPKFTLLTFCKRF